MSKDHQASVKEAGARQAQRMVCPIDDVLFFITGAVTGFFINMQLDREITKVTGDLPSVGFELVFPPFSVMYRGRDGWCDGERREEVSYRQGLTDKSLLFSDNSQAKPPATPGRIEKAML